MASRTLAPAEADREVAAALAAYRAGVMQALQPKGDEKERERSRVPAEELFAVQYFAHDAELQAAAGAAASAAAAAGRGDDMAEEEAAAAASGGAGAGALPDASSATLTVRYIGKAVAGGAPGSGAPPRWQYAPALPAFLPRAARGVYLLGDEPSLIENAVVPRDDGVKFARNGLPEPLNEGPRNVWC